MTLQSTAPLTTCCPGARGQTPSLRTSDATIACFCQSEGGVVFSHVRFAQGLSAKHRPRHQEWPHSASARAHTSLFFSQGLGLSG
eukprot:6208696-Pleurochrysis_carterae.AAC.7